MRIDHVVLAGFLLTAAPLAAQAPLSSIDWLNAPEQAPQLAPRATAQPAPQRREEPPTASEVRVPEVETMELGAPTVEAVGLLPMQVTGLPITLWQDSANATLIDLIGAVEPAVPAMSALLHTLLLAEANPPRGASRGPSFLAARLDRLLAQGVVDPAEALVERAQVDTAQLFERRFDIALLTGTVQPACEALMEDPTLSPDLGKRIFCMARNDAYDVALTTLDTARALESVTERDADLLLHFLDPALAEDNPPPRHPVRPSVLEFRLFEAIGEPLSTTALPRAFAHVDLNGDTGWKAQLDAAERLARVGAISENRLLGIYSLRRRSASGGIWDRVEAMQDFEAALDAGRPAQIGPALEDVWAQMRSARLLVPFSQLFGARLAEVELSGRAATLAWRAALMSEAYEDAAATLPTDDPERAFLAGIATGSAPERVPRGLPHAEAIAAAFRGAEPPEELQTQLDEGRLGEVILRAMALFSSGAAGNGDDLTDALALFRTVGLEDTARRAALQLILLEQEGVRQ